MTHPIRQHQQTLGLDAETGRVLWRVPRAQPSCIDARLARDEESPPVMCDFQGVVREEKGETLRYQDLAVEIDGYDPRSGATTWSVTATPRYA